MPDSGKVEWAWSRGELYDRLAALFDAQNEGGAGETVISANFLKIVVVK